jgi:hypothetical protein
MLRNLAFVFGYALVLVLFTAASVPAAQFGTAEEAKAMLEKAVAAVKEDRRKHLICSTRARAGSRTEIFMCSAHRTASSRRIRRFRANS